MFSICRERASAHRYTIHDISVTPVPVPENRIIPVLSGQCGAPSDAPVRGTDGAFLLPGHTEGIAGFERGIFRIGFMH